jgi:ABC-2 type transport system permease protein
MKNAITIFKKEIKEVIKNKSIWAPALILSIVFALILPIAFIIGADAVLEDESAAVLFEKLFEGQDLFASLVIFASKQLLIFLLLIPAMLPSLIAPASIILEKESRTLEPLLATPIKTSELLLGKSLTSIIPSFALSIINFILLSLAIDIASYQRLGYILLPNLEWVIVAFVLAPLISFVLTMLSLIVSSKSTDIRSAQGIGAVIIFPIYAVIGLQIGGFFLLNIYYLLLGCLFFLILCPIFLKIAIQVFDRENILTKWKLK